MWSLLWFWSSVLTVRPEAVITQWEKNKEEFNQELAVKMIARLKQSIAINSLDANSYLLMAKYYETLTKNKLGQYAELAELAYKNAIKHQPSWDYAWARLAQFYSNQQPINEINLMHALSKSILLGSYERKSQKIIIPLLFKHWPLFTNKEHVQANKIIKQALTYNPHAILTLKSARKYQQLRTLEPLLKQEWHKDRMRYYLRHSVNE